MGSSGIRLAELEELMLPEDQAFSSRWQQQEAINVQLQQQQLQQQLLEDRQALHYSRPQQGFCHGRDGPQMQSMGVVGQQQPLVQHGLHQVQNVTSMANMTNMNMSHSLSGTLPLRMTEIGFGGLEARQGKQGNGFDKLELGRRMGGTPLMDSKQVDISSLYGTPQKNTGATLGSPLTDHSVSGDTDLRHGFANGMLQATPKGLALNLQDFHLDSPQSQQPVMSPEMSTKANISKQFLMQKNNVICVSDLILISNQPAPFGRFRYKSEQRERPLEADKGFPEIQVNPKYLKIVPAGSKAVARLVTKTVDERGESLPHFHELTGTTEVLLQGPERKAVFDNLTVLMSKQGGHLEPGTARRNKEDQRAVRLRFEVTFVHQGTTFYGMATSHPVFNAKLLINKVSHAYGPATGQNEVVLLCSKVRKGTTTVCLSDAGLQSEGKPYTVQDVAAVKSEVAQWQLEEGTSLGTCVLPARYLSFHHQYAIVVEMPPYHKPGTEEPVRIQIQIIDFEDGTESPPVMYTYIPSEDVRQACVQESKKRRLDEGMRDFWQQFQGQGGRPADYMQ